MSSHVRFGASLLSAALVLTACSDDGITPIEDPPDASGEPAAPDVSPEEPEEPEDPEPEIFQGQLYPPLPDDLEPDPVAGDIEPQEEVLAILPGFYDAFESTFASNEVDARLPELMTDDQLEASEAELGAQQEQGIVGVSPDGQVGWVDVVAADSEQVAVGVCVSYGPETGAYDLETGEMVDDYDGLVFIRVFTFSPSTEAAGGWQVSRIGSQSAEGGSCDELRA